MPIAIILSDADRKEVETDVEFGELFAQFGPGKGYLNDVECHPARRAGGTGGNPDPCYVLGAQIIDNPDFATAQAYLSGLPQKSTTDPSYPGPYVP